MSKPIRLYFHDGLYYRRDPIQTVKNLFRFGTLHLRVYNAGDQLSPLIVEHLAQRKVKYAAPFGHGKLIGLGSGLAAAKPNDTVWGAGLGSADHVKYMNNTAGLSLLAVRGPDTRDALIHAGFHCPEVYGDPCILAPLLFPFRPNSNFKAGVVPEHPRIGEFNQRQFDDDVLLIPPSLQVEEFIQQLCQCELIVTGNLHALILADAYGIPAVPLLHKGRAELAFDVTDYIHSTSRTPVFIADEEPFDSVHARNKALEMGRPLLDPEPLLRAFPYKSSYSERLDCSQIACCPQQEASS